MITLFVIGEKNNIEWLANANVVANFSYSVVPTIEELPTNVSNSAVYFDSLKGVSVSGLRKLIRSGYHIFLNSPFELTINELNNLSLLAEEAGVYVFPRLPIEMKIPTTVGSTPLVGSVSMESSDQIEGDAWRYRCLEAISAALSILPYSVKRIRCVSGNKQPNSSVFMGCHLEFENSSLISISISNVSGRNSCLVQLLDSSGSYRYFEGSQENVDIRVKSHMEQFLQFIDVCNCSKKRFSVLGLDTISQILNIYSEMHGHFALA